MKFILSLLIFVLAYFFIVTEKINKTIVTIIGASLALILNLVTFEVAIAAIDFNVIFLLVGMMTCVYVLSRTGFFEWCAISVAKFSKGNPVIIMILLLSVIGISSAFLDNVTIIILFVPVTILIMQLLEISPIPFVIMEAIASNIGGTATLIGDPPNIVIGSQADLSFMDFIVNLTPIVTIIFIFFLGTVYFLFKKCLIVSPNIRSRVTEAIPSLAIVDKKNMIKSLIILSLIFIGFFIHDRINLKPGVIALLGSMIMLWVCKLESEDILMRVEWGVIFFFIGMFMMISALEQNGVILWVANYMLKLSGNNLFLMCVIILWGSAIFSSVLDNIPVVIVMVPLVKQFIAQISSSSVGVNFYAGMDISQPLWWSLALGVCLGGNGTLIGSSAGIVMARISEKNQYHISFKRFFKYGSLFMLQSMIISTIYIWWKYFK